MATWSHLFFCSWRQGVTFWQSAQHGFSDIQWMMIFVLPLLALYNGKQGRKNKWFFYIFYLSYLAVLYIISTVFFNK
ncbi:TraX family protein [Weissella cibaria]|uniref:TraX family protein n=1 Tax=Weissella cibaria TaxID=137591 RepID=UPI001FD7174B|nr:TraX family protein [Weissella cibaria]